MGFKHCIMFKFNETATPEKIAVLKASYEHLARMIPAVRSYSCGPDLKLGQDMPDFAIVADFDNVEGWREYMTHEEHQRIAMVMTRPMTAHRYSVQFET